MSQAWTTLCALLLLAITAQSIHVQRQHVELSSSQRLRLASRSPKELSMLAERALMRGDTAALTDIFNTINDVLIPKLHSEVAATQTKLDGASAAFSTCATSAETCAAELAMLEAAYTDAQTTASTAETTLSDKAAFTADYTGSFVGDTGEDEVEVAVTNIKNGLLEKASMYALAASARNAAKEAETTAETAYLTKKGECSGSCETCHSSAKTAHDAAVAEANTLLPLQKEDLKTYELLKCVCSESAGTNSAEVLAGCRSAETDVSSIKYDIVDAPASTCPSEMATTVPP